MVETAGLENRKPQGSRVRIPLPPPAARLLQALLAATLIASAPIGTILGDSPIDYTGTFVATGPEGSRLSGCDGKLRGRSGEAVDLGRNAAVQVSRLGESWTLSAATPRFLAALAPNASGRLSGELRPGNAPGEATLVYGVDGAIGEDGRTLRLSIDSLSQSKGAKRLGRCKIEPALTFEVRPD